AHNLADALITYPIHRLASKMAGARFGRPPTAHFTLNVLSSVAQFEHELLLALTHAAWKGVWRGCDVGWHKDRPAFGDVMGVSLASGCTLRFRRKEGSGWRRTSLVLLPRSVYLLR